jgi:alkyl hydroperoxide reductase subunit D
VDFFSHHFSKYKNSMENSYTEGVVNMLQDLGIDTSFKSIVLQKLSVADSRFLRDLKLNISAVLKGNNINTKEAHLLALATAVNEKVPVLVTAFESSSRREGATDAEIADVFACTAVMNTNNVFYRFRHYMHDVDYYNNQSAGLRMNVMMNPATGKEFFELLSLAVSALNGCERCVVSHERSVKEHGASEQRIYDAIRIVSVIKSLCVVM